MVAHTHAWTSAPVPNCPFRDPVTVSDRPAATIDLQRLGVGGFRPRDGGMDGHGRAAPTFLGAGRGSVVRPQQGRVVPPVPTTRANKLAHAPEASAGEATWRRRPDGGLLSIAGVWRNSARHRPDPVRSLIILRSSVPWATTICPARTSNRYATKCSVAVLMM